MFLSYQREISGCDLSSTCLQVEFLTLSCIQRNLVLVRICFWILFRTTNIIEIYDFSRYHTQWRNCWGSGNRGTNRPRGVMGWVDVGRGFPHLFLAWERIPTPFYTNSHSKSKSTVKQEHPVWTLIVPSVKVNVKTRHYLVNNYFLLFWFSAGCVFLRF